MDVTLYRKRDFADVIKALEMRSSWIPRWSLNPVTSVLIGDIQRGRRRREIHVKTEAQIGSRQLCDKGWLEPPEAGKVQGGILLWRDHSPADT